MKHTGTADRCNSARTPACQSINILFLPFQNHHCDNTTFMQTPPFSEGYLRFLMRREDVYDFRLGKSVEDVSKRLAEAKDCINDPGYVVRLAPPFRSHRSSKNLLFRPARFEDKLYLRHLNRRLCQAHNVRPSNRKDIVDQVASLMEADSLIKVVRADIRRFFRNIDFIALRNRFLLEGNLSSSELEAINVIGEFTLKYQDRGIPWGLSVSSTLAEIYLQELDRSVRSKRFVYYYERFVDDVIIFTSDDPKSVMDFLAKAVGAFGLSLNHEKSVSIVESQENPLELTYLGYYFKRTIKVRRKGGIESANVAVAISEQKIERIKKRISSSFSKFYKEHDLTHLRDRVRMITGNYLIKRSAHEAPIKSGIFFSYPATTERAQLIELDNFLRVALVGLICYARKAGLARLQPEIRKLFRFSFRSGFEKPLIHRVPKERICRGLAIWSK